MKRKMTFTIALAFVPAALGAQASGQASAQATGAAASKLPKPSATAEARANVKAEAAFQSPKGWSAEGSAKLEAMYNDARAKDLPREPMSDRVAEGQAKGASETAILASAGKVKANMEATHEAMVNAGRKEPTDEETARGASAMEHGVTRAQIEAMARRTPNERSLVVAFDVLSRLTARGVPVAKALAQIQTKLDARASDQSIISLTTQGGVSVGGTMSGGKAGAGTATAAGSGTTSGTTTGTTKGVTAGVTGAVTGVVKRP